MLQSSQSDGRRDPGDPPDRPGRGDHPGGRLRHEHAQRGTGTPPPLASRGPNRGQPQVARRAGTWFNSVDHPQYVRIVENGAAWTQPGAFFPDCAHSSFFVLRGATHALMGAVRRRTGGYACANAAGPAEHGKRNAAQPSLFFLTNQPPGEKKRQRTGRTSSTPPST